MPSFRRIMKQLIKHWKIYMKLIIQTLIVGDRAMDETVPGNAPDFVKDVLARIIAGEGDDLPVSALPVDGTFPSGTTKWEKRNIADAVPVWDTQPLLSMW